MLDEFIIDASEEFELNGRSDKFVAMENKILKSGKMLQAYYFARYVRGADVKRFQKFCLAKCSLAEAYYFVKHIPGFDAQPFIERAIIARDEFWTNKFNELKLKHEGADAKKRVKKNSNVAEFVKSVNFEYKNNPTSERTKQLLLEALHIDIDGNFALYARDIKGLDVKEIEKFTLLRGNPFTMLIVAKDIEGISKRIMMMGLIMARLDYIQREEVENLPRRGKRVTVEEEIYNPLSSLTYVEQVNNYIAELHTLMISK